ncbi:DNA (cytosine-5-)-methyltransferase [Salinicola endophyticus]|uniref:Cytosine-specific methyltransferase n=1 Tax=Salinicola endophyticus TaxID=1949083 RepID=A0AB74UF59_9GAMM
MSIAGLFSGIGGLELPFHQRNVPTELLCDVWDSSRTVLQSHFPDVPVWEDIANLEHLPDGVEIVTAGFPCTDLSQAGRTAGISGKESGLVSHVFRLLESRDLEWLVLENVRNMLALNKGQAMAFLVSKLEELGFSWAYRLVNSQFSGVPQRRHRVLFVASRRHDPRNVLFADDAGEPGNSHLRSDAYGFYWTEGLRGLGWAQDAVPPLKGGSGLGIPSPPGIWLPDNAPGMKLVIPSIEDAEVLQGFERGWTEKAQVGSKKGPRWKLVGNAVTVGVSDWLVGRLYNLGDVVVESSLLRPGSRWPDAAYGANGQIWEFKASHWPVQRTYQHLTDVLTPEVLSPLSHRASAGFLKRALRSSLRFNSDFLSDVKEHVELTTPQSKDIVSQRPHLRKIANA